AYRDRLAAFEAPRQMFRSFWHLLIAGCCNLPRRRIWRGARKRREGGSRAVDTFLESGRLLVKEQGAGRRQQGRGCLARIALTNSRLKGAMGCDHRDQRGL